MTHQPSTIDPKALSTLVAYWLDKATTEAPSGDFFSADYDMNPCVAALDAVGLESNDNSITGACGFEIGFAFALQAVAAIAADPIGNPSAGVEAAIMAARTTLAEMQREAIPA